MEKKPGIRQHLTLLAFFGVTLLLLGFTVDVDISDEAGVRTYLPDTLGESWVGYDVLFCHNPLCGRSWLLRDLEPREDGGQVCERTWTGHPCGGPLHPMSYGEYNVLPKDTVIFKKQYFHARDPEDSVYAAVVLSGSDRTSIHRPELCMTGQGHVIASSEVIEVPLEGRGPIQVMVLNLTRDLPGGQSFTSYYAYWFVGKDKETPHHLERMVWMGRDRIFRNVAHRWAYIAVSGARPREGDAHYARIREVVGQLYPQITLIGQEG